MKTDLEGKVTIITGGAGGIGSASARLFASCGAIVYITDINAESGVMVQNEIRESGGDVTFIEADATKPEEVQHVVETAAERKGRIDILLNICGRNIPLELRGKIRNYQRESWIKTIDMCMDSAFFFTKATLPYMKEHGGRIVNTGSVTGFRMGLRNQCAYNYAKAAIHNLTRSMAIEYAKYGITVNCIIPGSTWHENFRKRLLKTPDMAEKFTSHIPAHVANVPVDQAYGYLYLASPEAQRVTGVLLNIDNGWAAGYCR